MADENAHLPRVTLERDLGPIDLAFGFVPKGKPTYGDVPPYLDVCASEDEAEAEGAVMVAVGNWQWFTVEKRYYAAPEKGGTDG